MGRIIRLRWPAKKLIPTQGELREENTLSLLEYFFKHGRAPGPPASCKRVEGSERMYVLDGHHRLVIADVLRINEPLFLVEHEHDLIPQELAHNLTSEQLTESNEKVMRRFNYVTHIPWQFRKNYPPTIRKLREKYGCLKNERSMRMFFDHPYMPFE